MHDPHCDRGTKGKKDKQSHQTNTKQDNPFFSKVSLKLLHIRKKKCYLLHILIISEANQFGCF